MTDTPQETITLPLLVPDDHPSFAGHFPQFHILPGAVLLTWVCESIHAATGRSVTAFTSAKIPNSVLPGDALTLEITFVDDETGRLLCTRGGEVVLKSAFTHQAST